MQDSEMRALAAAVRAESEFVETLTGEMRRVVVGQRYLLERLLIGLLTRGHVLLEGVPGLAKTLSVRTLAEAIKARFRRIQFTPDLLPADIVGTLVYNPKEGTFHPRLGPIFAHIVLADEVNRAPAKVQSALLEAMQERQVTIGDTSYPLPDPFLVLATQNPIEHEGTYPLPEAQVDRFMLKLVVGYPTPDEERQILDRMTAVELPQARPVVGTADLARCAAVVTSIYIDDRIRDYIVRLVVATRSPRAHRLGDLEPLIQYGASPRATVFLALAARGHAFLRGRGFVTPEDVKAISLDVLRHRILLSYEAEAEGIKTDAIVRRLLETIEVP